MAKDEMGQVYVLHFDKKLSHAQHYIGFVEGSGQDAVDRRLEQHRSGKGAAILNAANKVGINYEVGGLYDGTRTDEREMKNQKNSSRYCDICKKNKF